MIVQVTLGKNGVHEVDLADENNEISIEFSDGRTLTLLVDPNVDTHYGYRVQMTQHDFEVDHFEDVITMDPCPGPSHP